MEAIGRAKASVQKLSQIRTYIMVIQALRDGGSDCIRYFGWINDCLKTRHLLGCEETVVLTGMEKARDLLLSEADKDISQIADAVGYNNSTYFTTAFKKFYGVTPSRFRDYHAVSEL